MHPRIIELEEHLALSRRVLNAAVQGVPARLHQQRPAENQWSVAEVLEHLSLLEHRLAVLLKKLIEQAKQENVGPDADESSVLAKIDVAVVLDRSRKVDALETVQPKRGIDSETAWNELQQSRRELVEVVRSADGLNLFAVQQAHPIFGPISAYHWIAFAGAHEQRHAAQIDEIGRVLAGRN